MISMKKLILFLIAHSLCFFTTNAAVSNKKNKKQQEGLGNFSVDFSQQPGPLIGFGQNVVEQGVTLAYAYLDYLKGDQKKFSGIAPSVVYGITDNLSLFVEVPVAFNYKVDCPSSRGIQDSLVQLEYAFSNSSSPVVSNVMTVVANMTLPTGSSHKTPPTGIGAISFFLGLTAAQTTPDWYYYMALGLIAPTTTSTSQAGNQFLYQFGISQNIASSIDSWIFDWMFEINGSYTQRTKTLEGTDCNSGGSRILLGPSLWFSTPRLTVQPGIFWFVESLFGAQNEDTYNAVINVSYRF